ncbi:PhoH family protein [soil metagenome]
MTHAFASIIAIRETSTHLSRQIEKTLTLDPSEAKDFGAQNEAKLRDLEKQFNARFVLRGSMLKIIGADADVNTAMEAVEELLEVQRRGGELSPQAFHQAVRQVSFRRGPAPAPTPPPKRGKKAAAEVVPAAPKESRGYDRPVSEIFLDGIPLPLKRRRLSPMTEGQKEYIETIRQKDIVFGIGPAGTGKTYLAVAMAVSALVSGRVSRIILCRPAVEAGEKLGFLPGDLKEKLDPYVRPLYDALYEMMEAEKIKQALDTGVIEIAPLAFMRGRTLNNSFVILDEAQNTTPEQMKMFLTRLGFESKAVITGDVTQIDLPDSSRSGLVQVQSVLNKLDDIGFVFFKERDVVRHELVMKIVKAYEAFEEKSGKKSKR